MSSDELAALSLLGRYCHAMDGDDVGAVLDVFTPDGVFAYYAFGADEPLLHFAGHEAIAGWFADHRAATPLGTQNHVTVNPSLVLDGSTGTASSTYTTLRARDGAIVIASTGRYDDRLRRGVDGSWRIAERIARADMLRP